MELRCDDTGQWHFSTVCRKWPVKSFNILRIDKFPTSLKLCPECQALSLTATEAFSGRELPPRSPRPTKT